VPNLARQPRPQKSSPVPHQPQAEQHCPDGHICPLAPPQLPSVLIEPPMVAVAELEALELEPAPDNV
jgi:hypothetical protein